MKRSRLNILFSYAFLNDDPQMRIVVEMLAPIANILIDSGAYSNFQKRLKEPTDTKYSTAKVELRNYIDYLKTIDGKVWQYIALDVIRQPKETTENLQRMLDAGLKPMPVYLENDREENLHKILQINKRICVAGGVKSADGYIRKRYQEVYDLSGKTALIHGLGYGRHPGIFYVPISSSDSSSYVTGSRYGLMTIYRPGGWIRLKWKYLYQTGDIQKKFITTLRRFGVSPEYIKNGELFHHSTFNIPAIFNTYSYLDFMDHVASTGKLYFFAVAAIQLLMFILVTTACQTESGLDIIEAIKFGNHLLQVSKEKGIEKVLDELIPMIKGNTEWKL